MTAPLRYSEPLIPATLLRRYKRFLADMRMEDGGITTVHCANPGSMLSLAVAGRRCWLSHHAGTARKLAYSWELEEAEAGCIGINTARANSVVAEALAAGAIPELAGWPVVRREVADGADSRLDFHLSGGAGQECWLEVKSVTMSRQPGLAEWPDAKSSRGARHLEALARLGPGRPSCSWRSGRIAPTSGSSATSIPPMRPPLPPWTAPKCGFSPMTARSPQLESSCANP